MRIIDLHCYPGTQAWIDSQGPYVAALARYWKREWVANTGRASHTVTSDSGAFDSGTLGNGGSFSFTFNDVGSFAYHCAFHSGMSATVRVVP
jgi:hypothetical protein